MTPSDVARAHGRRVPSIIVHGGAGAAVADADELRLGRRVLDDGRHVLLVGDGAHAFARAAGVAECDPATLVTERQRNRLAEGRGATPGGTLPGTVGATALDRHGTVAAATSTGGTLG